MAITATQIQQITDSVAQAISDFNTAFIVNTATNAPTAPSIISNVTGTGPNNTLGRVLNLADLSSELLALSPASKAANNVSAYITSIRSLSGFYQQYFPLLDALDLATGGLNLFLTTNSLQVSAWFAAAFNAYQALAIPLGYRSSATLPTALSAGNYFPYAAVDNMWSFTANSVTTFSANAVGANSNTSGAGGGTGQMYIYKSNAGAAAGGATFTISYLNGSGAVATATYTTANGTPAASGSLASAYAISGAVGAAVTGVTGTGMTSGESYTIGIKLVRGTAY